MSIDRGSALVPSVEILNYNPEQRVWFGLARDLEGGEGVIPGRYFNAGKEVTSLVFDRQYPGVVREAAVDVPARGDSRDRQEERRLVAQILGIDVRKFTAPKEEGTHRLVVTINEDLAMAVCQVLLDQPPDDAFIDQI